MCSPVVRLDVSHFVPLSSQGNIYSLSVLQQSEDSATVVLVTSLKRKVFSLMYERQSDGTPCPVVNQLSFCQQSPNFDLVSIDSFMKSAGHTVIALAVTKTDERSVATGPSGNSQQSADTHYLNIYSCSVDGRSFQLLPDGFCQLAVQFAPYQLLHAPAVIDSLQQNVFLLSGGDAAVHLYCENTDDSLSFSERPLDGVFPELLDLPSTALWIDFFWEVPDRRVTAVACECGHVRVSVVRLLQRSSDGSHCTAGDQTDCRVENTWSVQLDCLVSCVRLFGASTSLPPPPPPLVAATVTGAPQLQLLVVCVDAVSRVFAPLPVRPGDTAASELLLPPPEGAADAFTCCCVCDVNMDGSNELILGTYSQELLIYAQSNDADGENTGDGGSPWRLVQQFKFLRPLLAVEYVDMIGDCVNELVVLTTGGLSVLQHDSEQTAAILNDRLEKLNQLLDGRLNELLRSKSIDTAFVGSRFADNRVSAS